VMAGCGSCVRLDVESFRSSLEPAGVSGGECTAPDKDPCWPRAIDPRGLPGASLSLEGTFNALERAENRQMRILTLDAGMETGSYAKLAMRLSCSLDFCNDMARFLICSWASGLSSSSLLSGASIMSLIGSMFSSSAAKRTLPLSEGDTSTQMSVLAHHHTSCVSCKTLPSSSCFCSLLPGNMTDDSFEVMVSRTHAGHECDALDVLVVLGGVQGGVVGDVRSSVRYLTLWRLHSDTQLRGDD
jgi:hypothetical protein